MRTKAVPSSWIYQANRRLDCQPYMGGAIEARIKLEALRAETAPLREVTAGGIRGILNAGRFKRIWVREQAYGIPFLTSTDILKADLSRLSLISKKVVAASPALRIRKSWTLITRAGTVGRMAYARADMDGMACSEDVLRVIPDEAKISSGYLFAFLSTKFGIPLVTSGTYGAIIQHIEPEHIADLPVPRIGSEVEQAVHQLVQEASLLRASASCDLEAATSQVEEEAGLEKVEPAPSPTPFDTRWVPSDDVASRLDAFFHSAYHEEAKNAVVASQEGAVSVGELATSVHEPTRLKRLRLNDEEHGKPFFGTGALFYNEPVPIYLIPKLLPGIEQYIVERRTLLVPRSGQLSGIIGRVVMPHGSVLGSAVSEDAIRINCPDDEMAGYLLVALSSVYGVRQLKARAYGSSIPHLDVRQIRSVAVPNLEPERRRHYGRIAVRAISKRDMAIRLEAQARELIEQAIEDAA